MTADGAGQPESFSADEFDYGGHLVGINRPHLASHWWISLRGRIIFLVIALIAVNLVGAFITFLYTQRTQTMHAEVINRDLAALMAAHGLDSALIMQKGFVTYYFLNRDPAWLDQLGEHHEHFERLLKDARRADYTQAGMDILGEIESKYVRYAFARDQVIELYKEGRLEEGAALHWQVRDQFHGIYQLTHRYKRLHEGNIYKTQEEVRRKARLLMTMAIIAVPCTALLGVILAYVLFYQVLGPIRRLAVSADPGDAPEPMGDEVKSLGRRVATLLEDVDHAHSELEQSREQLMQTEKMALVGKMAAGVAHSVRNPLTSVKMRLFSLERGLKPDPAAKEDLDVISEEIRHIDTIVGNFLEFSRAPRLKKQMTCLSDVVDQTVDLVRHRLDSHQVELTITRGGQLPECQVDPDQMKEVLMNLVFNACEAMAEGGSIEIREETTQTGPGKRQVILRVADDGPGIPESVRENIFEPFFSTKEEGSGLGLSIVRRIIEEHGGQVELESKKDQGSAFVLTIPCLEV